MLQFVLSVVSGVLVTLIADAIKKYCDNKKQPCKGSRSSEWGF
ncbi:hypothetical protein [Weissella confusa]|nr:hypothetical protein [Weissella confusa]